MPSDLGFNWIDLDQAMVTRVFLTEQNTILGLEILGTGPKPVITNNHDGKFHELTWKTNNTYSVELDVENKKIVLVK